MAGGSSAVNFLTYHKPSKEEIDGKSGTMPGFPICVLMDNSMGAAG